MGLASAIWDTATALLVWARAGANEVAGRGQVDVAGDTRNDVEHLALPGHYSVIAASDELLLLRRDDGGVSVAARTERPTGATAGDRGLLTSKIHVRLRDDVVGVLDRVGVSSPLKVARDDDLTHAYGDMVTFLSTLATMLGVPTPVNFGQIDATTTHLVSD